MRDVLVLCVAVLAASGCDEPRGTPRYALGALLVQYTPTRGGPVDGGEVPSGDERVEARVSLTRFDPVLLGSIRTEVEDAVVTLRWRTGAAGYSAPVTLRLSSDRLPPEYVATALDGLVWVEGAEYAFEVRHGDHVFDAIVAAPPRTFLRLVGPHLGGVLTTSRPVLEPAALERDCTDACPRAYPQVFWGSVSFLPSTRFTHGADPTCSGFPIRAGQVPGALAHGSTGTRVPLLGPDCFDRVVPDASEDELFFPTLVAVQEGRVLPHPALVAGDSAALAGVGESLTVHIPAP